MENIKKLKFYGDSQKNKMIAIKDITASWLAENIPHETLLGALQKLIGGNDFKNARRKSVVNMDSSGLKVEDIQYFTKSSKGQGRESNDSNNKKREEILLHLFNTGLPAFQADPHHGTAWKKLDAAFREIISQIAVRYKLPSESQATITKKAGRGQHKDFLIEFVGPDGATVDVSMEFKFGAKCIPDLPEFLNTPADKKIVDTLYASYYYKKCVPQLHTLYKIPEPLPTEEEYIKHIHKNTPSTKWLKALDAADRIDSPNRKNKKADGPLKKQLDVLAKQSISEYLETVQVDLKALTNEFQLTQEDKNFVCYKDGKFYLDFFQPNELTAVKRLPVKNGNTLVVESGVPTTQHHLLLRWKNHNGILFPAWQIKLCRTSK
jgi:hypothetical protein